MQITVNGRSTNISRGEDLQEIMQQIFTEEYHEIWLSGHQESQLCVMLNQNSAFAMYLKYGGDQGFRTHSSVYNLSKEVEEFRLANGQVDIYPKGWLLKKEQAKGIIETYVNTGLMDSRVKWIEKE